MPFLKLSTHMPPLAPHPTPQSIKKSMLFLKLHPPSPHLQGTTYKIYAILQAIHTHTPLPWLPWSHWCPHPEQRCTARLEKIEAWSCHTACQRTPLAPSKIPHSVQACNARFPSLWWHSSTIPVFFSLHISTITLPSFFNSETAQNSKYLFSYLCVCVCVCVCVCACVSWGQGWVLGEMELRVGSNTMIHLLYILLFLIWHMYLYIIHC